MSTASQSVPVSSERCVVRIVAGECHVSSDEIIATTLGSCISACIRDRRTGVGGMNHFMLPDSGADARELNLQILRYGVHAMEFLVNEILRRCNERRQDLEVKLVGGGEMLGLGAGVGRRNLAFAERFVNEAGIRLVATDTGGPYGRAVRYLPATGQLFVKRLAGARAGSVVEQERNYRDHLVMAPVGGDEVELF